MMQGVEQTKFARKASPSRAKPFFLFISCSRVNLLEGPEVFNSVAGNQPGQTSKQCTDKKFQYCDHVMLHNVIIAA